MPYAASSLRLLGRCCSPGLSKDAATSPSASSTSILKDAGWSGAESWSQEPSTVRVAALSSGLKSLGSLRWIRACDAA